jgi:hypothetical protein
VTLRQAHQHAASAVNTRVQEMQHVNTQELLRSIKKLFTLEGAL